MKDKLAAAINNYVDDKDIEISDELIFEWIDEKIDAVIAIDRIYQNTLRVLPMGKLDKEAGEYETEIAVCGWGRYMGQQLGLHIYNNIELISDAVGIPLIDDDDEKYFMYRDVRVYMLKD